MSSPRDRRDRRDRSRSRSGERNRDSESLSRDHLHQYIPPTPAQIQALQASLAQQHIAPPSIHHHPPLRPPRVPRMWGRLNEENASNPLQWTKFIFDTPRAANTICTLCDLNGNTTPTREFYGHENSRGSDHLFCLEHYTDYRTTSDTPDACPVCRRNPMAIWRQQRVMDVADDGTKRVREHGEIGLPRLYADVRGNSGGKKRKNASRRYKRARVTRRGRYNRVRVTRRNHQSKKQK